MLSSLSTTWNLTAPYPTITMSIMAASFQGLERYVRRLQRTDWAEFLLLMAAVIVIIVLLGQR